MTSIADLAFSSALAVHSCRRAGAPSDSVARQAMSIFRFVYMRNHGAEGIEYWYISDMDIFRTLIKHSSPRHKIGARYSAKLCVGSAGAGRSSISYADPRFWNPRYPAFVKHRTVHHIVGAVVMVFSSPPGCAAVRSMGSRSSMLIPDCLDFLNRSGTGLSSISSS